VSAALLSMLLALAPASGAGCDVRDVVAQAPRKAASGHLSAEEREWLLALHNRCRATATPAPLPALPPLRWDAAAAAVAQRWADRCEFAHNAGRGDYGENIAYRTRPEIGAIALLWIAEGADYSRSRAGCSTGHQCGHYTQVVARRSTAVGCAAATCAFGRYLACDYAPPGNFVGQPPY
jgi:pathogenesis-related protein 1